MIEDKDRNQNVNVIQNLILENREKLNISGVLDVLSFDDRLILLETELGILTVKGEKLRVNKLNLDSEDVIVDGIVQSIAYSNNEFENKKTSFLGKIFK